MQRIPTGRELPIEYILPDSEYIVRDVLEIPSYELEGPSMRIHDVVWGQELIGSQEYDGLFMQLARSPLFRRLQAVEQLTLPAEYTTIPNTARFSRWQHIWGSLVFVRKMTEGDERYSERDRAVMQLRTLFSDVGQTAFSHLGDWIFQEDAKNEDLHDQDLRALLESFQVDELLTKYGLTLDETVFPEIEDWIECPSPDLCVDRVDYGLREILRWLSPPSNLHTYRTELANPKQLFRINGAERLEITDVDFARHFGLAYNLLPTEHWAQPAHRLQLELMQTAVKRALLNGHFSEGIMLSGRPHPRDRMYGIDSDFRPAFYDWDGITLSKTMRTIGFDQRQVYGAARRHDLGRVFHTETIEEFPNPLESYSWESKTYGLTAPQVEIEPDDTTGSRVSIARTGLRLHLPPLKLRSIDPLVYQGGESSPLSEVQKDFAQFRAGQLAMVHTGYTASLLLNRHTATRLYDMVQSTDEHWHTAADRPRSIGDLREIVGQAAFYAAGRCFDNISEI